MDIRRRTLLSETLHEGGSSEGSINIDNYLTIEALEDGLTASLSDYACNYCVDGDGNWKTLLAGTTTEVINTGHTLSFRGNRTPSISSGIGTFTISKKCNLKGNCMSMLFNDDAADNYRLSGKRYAFYKLFKNCTNIVTISENFLPAITLGNYCYRDMFRGCTSLTTAPELPATMLAHGCYYYMFEGCTNLTTAPTVLPATKVATYCYAAMFEGCTKLTTAPTVLPATTLDDQCYYSMFEGCTNLTTAPELPATTLKQSCYTYMFSGCTNLKTAPALPATTLTYGCYQDMFSGCTSLTTVPELPATTLASYCYCSMFEGCTSLTTAPELPATTLASNCYCSMFEGCTKLNYIKMLATDISARSCLSFWVKGVAGTGTFVKHPNMNSLPTGTSGIPSGWTVVNDGEESGGELLEFTVRDTATNIVYGPYQFEEGMTGNNFYNSEYCVSPLVNGTGGIYIHINGFNFGSFIDFDEVIQPIQYTVNSGGGSGEPM